MGREVDDRPSGGRGKPRLFIKKMVLENFKSYAGKKHIGPFHKVSHGPAVVMNRIVQNLVSLCFVRFLTIHVDFDSAVFLSCCWTQW